MTVLETLQEQAACHWKETLEAESVGKQATQVSVNPVGLPFAVLCHFCGQVNIRLVNTVIKL